MDEGEYAEKTWILYIIKIFLEIFQVSLLVVKYPA